MLKMGMVDTTNKNWAHNSDIKPYFISCPTFRDSNYVDHDGKICGVVKFGASRDELREFHTYRKIGERICSTWLLDSSDTQGPDKVK